MGGVSFIQIKGGGDAANHRWLAAIIGYCAAIIIPLHLHSLQLLLTMKVAEVCSEHASPGCIHTVYGANFERRFVYLV